MRTPSAIRDGARALPDPEGAPLDRRAVAGGVDCMNGYAVAALGARPPDLQPARAGGCSTPQRPAVADEPRAASPRPAPRRPSNAASPRPEAGPSALELGDDRCRLVEPEVQCR